MSEKENNQGIAMPQYQSPDLKLTCPQTLNKLKQCSKEEYAKIPPQQCETLKKSYRKRLLQVIAAKGVLQATESLGVFFSLTAGSLVRLSFTC